MPDITMCKGEGCARRAECYRHVARSSGAWQSWFRKAPVREDGTCEYWWPTSKGRTK